MEDSNTRIRPKCCEKERTNELPLSHAQRQLWLIAQRSSSLSHQITVKLRLRGRMDVSALRSALDRIIARHQVLRCTFVGSDEGPTQVCAPIHAGFKLVEQDIGGHEAIEQSVREESTTPFDLSRGPLIRGRLLRLSDTEHILLMTQHRIVADDSSIPLLIRELSALYSAFSLCRGDPLPPLELQFGDFANWQLQHVPNYVLNRQLEFWTRALGSAPALTQLPTDRTRASAPSYPRDCVRLKLSTALGKRLVQLARQQRVSLLVTTLSSWAVLLARWCGQTEVIIGARVTNRQREGTASLIGPLENTVAVRICMQQDPTVEELLQKVHALVTDAHAHGDVPFEAVVEALDLVHVGTPLAQMQVTVDDADLSTLDLQLPGLKPTEVSVGSTATQFDLSLSLSDAKDGLTATLNYAADLFERGTIERMAACWETLLKGLVKHARRPISRIAMLPATQRELVLYRFNDTAAPTCQGKLIHTLFQEQAERTPDAIAVMHAGQSLTYAELNGCANQVARYLGARGVRADQVVGICVERSLQMVVGLLGILKSGAAYVPLDPNYPPDRLAYMVEDAAPALVLTQEKLRALLPVRRAHAIDLVSSIEVGAYPKDNLSSSEQGSGAPNRVYVIYTSGSTGRPKGTEMPHRAMVNLIEWHRSVFSDNEAKRVLQFAALSFDVAFQETFTTLCSGGTLVLLDEWVRRDSKALTELLLRCSIQRLFVPPLMLQRVAECVQSTGVAPAGLEDVITAGEQLRITPEIAGFFKRLAGCRLHNHYGPTETHVVTALTLTGDPDSWPMLPAIGRPIANTQIYVLDARGQPVPAGVGGEIHIGGANVACGYLNQSQLSAKRFIADPFGSRAGSRLYRSGDRGRWCPDGTLQYLGRNDDQLKIRGFRVEPGEIETQLARHPQVRDAAVAAREDAAGDKRLVAYVTPRAEDLPCPGALRTFLKASLPDHMVPSAFVLLQQLPLTPSGKVDRRALPDPDNEAYVTRPYAAPQGEIEMRLADIWQELLGIDRVGRDDNFFELGGDSLLLAKVMERLQRARLAGEPRHMFQSRNLAEFASALTRSGLCTPPNLIPSGCEVIRPQMLPLVKLKPDQIEHIVKSVPGGAANVQDIYPLAPLQEGLLFHHVLNQRDADTYVIPTLLCVASRQRLAELIAALQSVIDRHDALRTAVLWEDLPRPVQVVYRRAILLVRETVLNAHAEVTEQLQGWMRPPRNFDLRLAPLLRLVVAADPHGEQWYALMQIHHLVADNTTEEIIRSEVVAHLEGLAHQLPPPLPYRNHVAQVMACASSSAAEAFFRSRLASVDEPTAPFGLLTVHSDCSRMEEARRPVEPALAKRLRSQARRLRVSAATLFHTAWSIVVAHTSARDDVVFGSVLLGRLQGSSETGPMAGMFINTLPLHLRLGDSTAGTLVQQVHRELAELLTHEQASLAAAQRCSGIAGSAPLFTALFNFRHGPPVLDSEWPGAQGVRVLAHRDRTNYPIALSVDDLGTSFALTVQADRSIGSQRLIDYVAVALRSLVDALEHAPQTPALALSILAERDQRQVIDSFNSTRSAYPRDKVLHELFEEQVERAPHATAIACDGLSLTYLELNCRANQLARCLRAKGMGPDKLVGICVERGALVAVGLLAILKARAAYVPLDPNYPSERIAYMLEDSGLKIVLTQEHLKPALAGGAVEVIALDGEWNEPAAQAPENRELRAGDVSPHHLAYVIYTSGSTGKPKGVMIEHRNVVNLWYGLERIYAQSAHDCHRIALNASLNFDASVQQLVQLLSGRSIFVVPERCRRDASLLLRFVDENQIDGIDCTPSQLKAWIAEGLLDGRRRNPKVVLVGGEAIDAQLWTRLAQAAPTQFYNVYGPTECTVDATFAPVTCDAPGPHIGRPMLNRRVYVLDRRGRPVPPGVTGEIHIGGAGVGRGYLNRPELTADRFVADPFGTHPQARMYKTGDTGRWLIDGTLQYLGRSDHQVKLRGHRIELGEIEAQLARHEFVKEAVVVVQEGGSADKRLVAYITTHGSNDVSASDLLAHMKSLLPGYMIPAAFVRLEKLPLTPSGKLDHRALPAPESDAYSTRQYEAPQGDVEAALARLWQELLSVERVGREDNFFDLGGHSLLAMQMIVRLRALLSIDVPMEALFKAASLRQLSSAIEELRQTRLVEDLERGGADLDELLDSLAALPESKVQEYMRELKIGGRL